MINSKLSQIAASATIAFYRLARRLLLGVAYFLCSKTQLSVLSREAAVINSDYSRFTGNIKLFFSWILSNGLSNKWKVKSVAEHIVKIRISARGANLVFGPGGGAVNLTKLSLDVLGISWLCVLICISRSTDSQCCSIYDYSSVLPFERQVRISYELVALNLIYAFQGRLTSSFLTFSCLSRSGDCEECGAYVRRVYAATLASLSLISLLVVLISQRPTTPGAEGKGMNYTVTFYLEWNINPCIKSTSAIKLNAAAIN